MKEKLLNVLKLFLAYLKIGLFTFGGGYAMIALIEDEIVNKRKWITKEELTDIVTIAESTPGPIAINCATYVGYKFAGVLGSVFATIGVVVPSFVIIFVISLFFDAFLQIQIVAYAFNGIKCAVGIIIIRTGFKMFKDFKKTVLSVTCFAISFLTILAINIFAIDFSSIYLILIGAVIGIVVYVIDRNKNKINENQEQIKSGEKLSCRQKRKIEKERKKQEKLQAKLNKSSNEYTDNNQVSLDAEGGKQ